MSILGVPQEGRCLAQGRKETDTHIHTIQIYPTWKQMGGLHL